MSRPLLHRMIAILAVCLAIVFFCALGMDMISASASGIRQSGPWEILLRSIQATGRYLANAATGNLGRVWKTVGRNRVSVSIASMLFDTYTKSMGLLLVALALAAVLGVVAGGASAYYQGSPLSLAVLTTTLLGISLPTFFAALVLQVIEIWWYQRTGVRLVPVGGFGWDTHLVLPALVLAARPLAQIARMTFVSLTESANQEYVTTAKAKGLPVSQIWASHIVPNSAVAIVSAIGVSARFSLGSLPVVEYYFGWPGLGATLLSAVRARQTDLVITLALALGVTFMLLNLILDLSYRWLDPRLRDHEAAR